MGNDVPAAVLRGNHTAFSLFQADVRPGHESPYRSIREELVMTLSGYLGSLQQNLLDESPIMLKWSVSGTR